MMFFSRYKKILVANAVFLILLGLIFVAIEKNNARNLVSVPVPEGGIFTGDVGTSTPIRVTIPVANIEGAVLPVGKTKSGNMAVPVKYEDVGWYRYGPIPGAIGNAVLAGHLDNGGGRPAVFFNLKQLRIGDKVYVETDGGERLAFMVREIRLVDYENPPLEEIFGEASGEMLNLITCDGTWDPKTKTYDKRLVVFTERVRE